MSVLDYFPRAEIGPPRQGQIAVLNEIEKVLPHYRFIIVEAAVGAGKSAIAKAIADAFGPCHILTPQKALQDQYHKDFNDTLVLMKGRSSYPCVLRMEEQDKDIVRRKVTRGDLIHVHREQLNCGNAPCRDSETIYNRCTDPVEGVETNPCPYTIAIERAQESPVVVHNLHSYIYQTNYGKRFHKRPVMIIDEGHEIEKILRDFTIFKVSLPGLLDNDEERTAREKFEDIDDWIGYFTQPRFVPRAKEESVKYLERITKLEEMIEASPSTWANFVVRIEEDSYRRATHFELIPEKLGTLPERFLYSGGDKIIIMSGTVYNKERFCRDRGIPADQAYMIRLGSTFPLESRPIIMKDEYMVDTSHKSWYANLEEMAEKIKKVLNVFSDVKGLIHVPSYRAANEVMTAVGDPRLITHTQHDTQERLMDFYNMPGNAVFVSPVCQQGVDFKHDRARFQIIMRVPYLNAGDPFVEFKIKRDFAWYNYQALIIFGQQLGRVNRSESDFGVTVLMDSRFPSFIRKNKIHIPKWVLNAIKEK